MPKPEIDAIDCHIIAELQLQSDARLSNVELADKVGLSPSPCLRRVKRLEQGRLYPRLSRGPAAGPRWPGVFGLCRRKLNGHANDGALAFEKAVVEMPEVVACHLVSGEADYFPEVVVPDLAGYQRFLVGKLLNLPIVREVRSNVAIQTLKAGAPLPLEHLNTAMRAQA